MTTPPIRFSAKLFDNFPKLPRDLKASSPHSDKYICFSLGVGDTDHLWAPEPAEDTCWLHGVPRSRAISSFVRLFEELGYEKCGLDTSFVRGTRKIAIYAKGGNVEHVAVQPSDRDGLWHSKLGFGVNIHHELDSLVGDYYGEVVQVMIETKPSPSAGVINRKRVIFRSS